ncbi:claspin [Diachasmimorpha longicaudata]|uniref:claspin n=1 Tax=Diachasmimorpha longicaudata TaxID=58733 RepID=UPI0030B8AB82
MEQVPEDTPADSGDKSDAPVDMENNSPASTSEAATVHPDEAPSSGHDDDKDEVMPDKPRNGKRSRVIFNSDSEDEPLEKMGNGSKDDDSDDDTLGRVKRAKSGFSKVRVESDSDSDHHVQGEDNTTPVTEQLNHKSTKISSLIDSESEEESPRPDCNEEEPPRRNSSPKKSKNVKKPINQSKRAAKDDALNRIRSETQRLIRESSVCLPYHRPKQRTLDDFLSRKKISAALPKATTTASRLKISASIVNQVLKEKEKEAEIFYKSSDSEEDLDDQEELPPPPEPEKQSIEETQKLQKVDVHNRQQIIHNGSLEFGVPRKLFMEGASPGPPGDTLEERTDEEGNLPQKEFKRGLKEASVPRKLFDDGFDEGAGTPSENKHVLDLESRVGLTIPGESPEDILGASESPGEPAETLEGSLEPLKEITCEENGKSEDFAISETPLVPNKEFMKINVRHCPLKKPEDVGKSMEDKEVEEDTERNDSHDHGPSLQKSSAEEERNDFVTPQMPITILAPPPAPQIIKKAVLLNATKEPKLRGNPGMMIDLTHVSRPDKAAVDSLVDRFFTKHAAVAKNEDKDSEVTILNTEVTPSGLKIIRDTLSYKTKGDRYEDSELNKPGAKLLRLKEELEKKMAVKRNEEWKLREREVEALEDDEEEDDDEEKVMTVDDEEEGESEPEEDDVLVEDKERKRSAFEDDEAEVSGDDDISDDENEDQSDENGEDEEADDENEEEQEDEAEKEDEEGDELNKSKKFSRIIQLEDDSDEENDDASSSKKPFERTNTDVDIFADEEEVNSTQASQTCKTPSAMKKPLSLGSPLSEFSQLTSQSASASKNLFSNTQTSDFSPLITLTSPKPLSLTGELESVKNKLFEQDTSPVNDADLFDLCSGRFPDDDVNTQSSTKPNLKGLMDPVSSEKVTDSQLIGLCSGTFATQPEVPDNDRQDPDDDLRLTFDDEPVKIPEPNALDEEVPRNPLDIASSSEDEENTAPHDRKNMNDGKKKKVNKLVLSDDEDEFDKEKYSSDESELEGEPEDEKFVDYDSEENEVMIVPKKDIKKVAANYLEAEAELSESEWGSEDEDERDLDTYEAEEADTEEIDETLVRNQIGKIHARQVMDEDKRDVRMLKEMLFDDGDLHEDGQGRERKFRWKNIDKIGLEDAPTNEEDAGEEEIHEGDNELEWRKLRLERQKFLEEKSREEGDSELGGGQLFSLGLRALKRNHTSVLEAASRTEIVRKTIVPRSASELMQCSLKASRIVNTAAKRGSFLSRGDEVLARLAVMTKQADVVGLAPKKGANFVFSHLSPSVNGETEEGDGDDDEGREKGKLARKRKLPAGITPKATKKSKVEMERSSGKKLF